MFVCTVLSSVFLPVTCVVLFVMVFGHVVLGVSRVIHNVGSCVIVLHLLFPHLISSHLVGSHLISSRRSSSSHLGILVIWDLVSWDLGIWDLVSWVWIEMYPLYIFSRARGSIYTPRICLLVPNVA
jgi:hypothetical protein